MKEFPLEGATVDNINDILGQSQFAYYQKQDFMSKEQFRGIWKKSIQSIRMKLKMPSPSALLSSLGLSFILPCARERLFFFENYSTIPRMFSL